MGKIPIARRSRTPNWSTEEKQYLLVLIKNNNVVVVVKNNGANQYEEKNLAWMYIVNEMESRFGSKFTDISTKKVKTQWQNMKRIAREEIVNGGTMETLTPQSAEVCRILDMVEDGVLMKSMIDSLRTSNATPSVEVKTERQDDDFDLPSCSGGVANIFAPNFVQNEDMYRRESSSPGALEISDDIAENLEDERRRVITTDKASMTEPLQGIPDFLLDPFQKDLQENLKFSATVKMLKLETIKEERQVIRAMRESAELNKIIAEQRLKHLLWAKRQATA